MLPAADHALLQRLDARLFKVPAAVRATVAQVKSFAGPTLALEALRYALHKLPPDVQERFRPTRRGEGMLLSVRQLHSFHVPIGKRTEQQS